jgi:L-lactate permease
LLIGLGFKPLPAAGLSLIGNTAPVAFGALGTPEPVNDNETFERIVYEGIRTIAV